MTIWPLAVYVGLVLLIVGGMIGVSYVLGERHREPEKGDPYEGGIAPAHSARVRFPAKFYLIAMFFVIFDLEVAVIFAWAIAARQVGWAGYYALLIFAGVLGAALLYLWRLGALDLAGNKRDLTQ